MNDATRRRVKELVQEIIELIESDTQDPEPTEPASNVTPIRRVDEVELEGIIGRPELKEVRGKTLFTAGLGVKEGNLTRWHNLSAWGSTAEAASVLTRGQVVRVVGRSKEVSYVDTEGRMCSKRELSARVISPIVHAGSASSDSTA